MFPKRVKLFNYFVIAFFVGSLIKIFNIQIINGHIYKRQSQKQSYQLNKIQPDRGLIFSSDGIPLVSNQTKYQISLYKPNMTASNNDFIDLFSSLVDETDNALIQKFFSNQNQLWISLNTYLDQNQINQLQKIDGIVITPIQIRFYPESALAKDLTGFLSQNRHGLLTGYDGLEGYYNQRLTGRTGFIWQTRDAVGQSVFSQLNWSKPKIDGTSLHTSIDKYIQFVVEEELSQGLVNYQAESISAVVMESLNGAIVAMSTKEASPSAIAKNRVITDLYEPGSIFKPITVSIALDSLSIDKDFICQKCNQDRFIDGHQITNWDFQNHPDSNLKDIIKNSDNIGMSYIMDEIDFDIFLKYASQLGLNQKTGIDLQGESKPKFDKSYWSALEIATASFGQGFAITNIQMLTAFNSIAANGQLFSPRVVSSFQDQHKTKTNPVKSKQVFSKTTTDYIKTLLKNNVDNSNLSKLNTTKLDVCGKTGTAQVAKDGQYGQDTNASFIAFFPCTNPLYTISVTVRYPKTSPWGDSTAAPIWFKIAQKIDQKL